MTEDPSRRRLGRGLAALIGEIGKPRGSGRRPGSRPGFLPIARSRSSSIRPNPRNPRRSFAEADLADLAQSIREHGLVQPLVVAARLRTQAASSSLIAGERRWRAAQRAGLSAVPRRHPCCRRPNGPRARHRRERPALRSQSRRRGARLQPSDRGARIFPGRSGAGDRQEPQSRGQHVTLAQASWRSCARCSSAGRSRAGHARTLVTGVRSVSVARRIIEEGLSVRQAEMLAQNPAAPAPGQKTAPRPSQPASDADTAALEKLLGDATGLADQDPSAA